MATRRVDFFALAAYHESVTHWIELGMRILPNLLSYVLVVPLLLPPGVCVCHFQAAPSAAHLEEDDPDGTCLAFGPPDCQDHHATPCPHRPSPLRRHDGPIPADSSDQHVPGCPALKTVFVGRCAQDAEQPHSATGVAGGEPFPDPGAAVLSPPVLHPSPHLGSADPSLYLLLLTLRI